MDQRLLTYFICVVEKASFTSAASALHISQPSLSAAIKKLESKLGLKLLNRSTRNLKLTREGEILYEEAKKLTVHFDHIAKEMKRLKQEGPLELNIGLIESAKFWLPKIIKSFKQQYQDVHIKLYEILGYEEVIHSLNHFDTHFVITNQFIELSEMTVEPLYEEKLVALIPQTHHLVKKNAISLFDLSKENLIITKKGFQTREDTLNAFQKASIYPKIAFEIERFETACSLVENGLGITIVPENYVKYSTHTPFQIKQINDDHISRSVYLAYVKNRYLPPIVRHFMNQMRDFFESSMNS